MATVVRLQSELGVLVAAEFSNDGIREREPNERVHLRIGEDTTACLMCHSKGIWLDDMDRWIKHPFRCDPA